MHVIGPRRRLAQCEGQPRSKASGIPFQARFVDVAKEAGLTHPVICGDPVKKDYIVETVGCGCAFLDYDNDGCS
jgi:hypothetical protein